MREWQRAERRRGRGASDRGAPVRGRKERPCARQRHPWRGRPAGKPLRLAPEAPSTDVSDLTRKNPSPGHLRKSLGSRRSTAPRAFTLLPLRTRRQRQRQRRAARQRFRGASDRGAPGRGVRAMDGAVERMDALCVPAGKPLTSPVRDAIHQRQQSDAQEPRHVPPSQEFGIPGLSSRQASTALPPELFEDRREAHRAARQRFRGASDRGAPGRGR